MWVCKISHKETRFDVKKAKETFMDEKRSFVDEGASTSRAQNMGKSEETSTT